MKRKKILILVVIALVALLLLTFLMLKKDDQSMTIEQVKEKHESELIAIKGVVGVGIGNCDDNKNNSCIKVYLENDSLDLRKKIPARLDGFKVDINVTGQIVALPR